MLACDVKHQHAFQNRTMRNACGSNSRCGVACDASAGAMRIASDAGDTLQARTIVELLEPRDQGPLNGGFKRGGFPVWTCPSLFVLFRPFWDFPDFSGIFPICPGVGPGIFPICPFPLSRPINSTYEEQSRKGPRHNPDLSGKKVGNPPGLETPPVFASPKENGP